MGVKGLWRLLLPIGRRISIETLEGRVLAIDASIWLTQFLTVAARQRDPNDPASHGGRRNAACYSCDYLVGFLRRLCRLRYQGVRPVLVFDGATPEIKRRELADRARRKRRRGFGEDHRSLFPREGSGKSGDGNASDGDDEWREATRRMAKRILARQLRSGELSTTKKNRAVGKADAATNNNSSSSSSSSSNSNNNNHQEQQQHQRKRQKTAGASKTSYATGFYDPDAAAAEDATNKHLQPDNNNNNNENDDDDDHLLQDDYTSNNRFQEAVNDFDAAIVVHSDGDDENNNNNENENSDDEFRPSVEDTRRGRRRPYPRKRGKQTEPVYDSSRFHDGDGTGFRVDSVAGLPESARRGIIEDVQRERRMASRREFLGVASNPEELSGCQIRNFLKSTRLKKDIAEMARAATKRAEEEAKMARGNGILFEKEGACAGPQEPAGGHRRRRHYRDHGVPSGRRQTPSRMRMFPFKGSRATESGHSDDEHDFHKARNNHYLAGGIRFETGDRNNPDNQNDVEVGVDNTAKNGVEPPTIAATLEDGGGGFGVPIADGSRPLLGRGRENESQGDDDDDDDGSGATELDSGSEGGGDSAPWGFGGGRSPSAASQKAAQESQDEALARALQAIEDGEDPSENPHPLWNRKHLRGEPAGHGDCIEILDGSESDSESEPGGGGFLPTPASVPGRAERERDDAILARDLQAAEYERDEPWGGGGGFLPVEDEAGGGGEGKPAAFSESGPETGRGERDEREKTDREEDSGGGGGGGFLVEEQGREFKTPSSRREQPALSLSAGVATNRDSLLTELEETPLGSNVFSCGANASSHGIFSMSQQPRKSTKPSVGELLVCNSSSDDDDYENENVDWEDGEGNPESIGFAIRDHRAGPKSQAKESSPISEQGKAPRPELLVCHSSSDEDDDGENVDWEDGDGNSNSNHQSNKSETRVYQTAQNSQEKETVAISQERKASQPLIAELLVCNSSSEDDEEVDWEDGNDKTNNKETLGLGETDSSKIPAQMTSTKSTGVEIGIRPSFSNNNCVGDDDDGDDDGDENDNDTIDWEDGNTNTINQRKDTKDNKPSLPMTCRTKNKISLSVDNLDDEDESGHRGNDNNAETENTEIMLERGGTTGENQKNPIDLDAFVTIDENDINGAMDWKEGDNDFRSSMKQLDPTAVEALYSKILVHKRVELLENKKRDVLEKNSDDCEGEDANENDDGDDDDDDDDDLIVWEDGNSNINEKGKEPIDLSTSMTLAESSKTPAIRNTKNSDEDDMNWEEEQTSDSFTDKKVMTELEDKSLQISDNLQSPTLVKASKYFENETTTASIETKVVDVDDDDDDQIDWEAGATQESNIMIGADDWGSTKTKSSDEIAAALEHAQGTAANLTNWAGRAFRRAIAQHALENGMEIPKSAKPCVLNSKASDTDEDALTLNKVESDIHSTQGRTRERSESKKNHPLDRNTRNNKIDNSDWLKQFDQTISPATDFSIAPKEAIQSDQMMDPTNTGITDEMRAEVMQLLRLFGVPYVVAPAEAEAQCVELEKLGLVDGIVTEDSDTFVFGGEVVYKNIFEDKKFVEVYHAKDASEEMNLNQDALVALAMLLGGDYTEGVKGVGIVNGMEILQAFDVAQDCKAGLTRFRKWLDGFDPLYSAKNNNSATNITGASTEKEKSFHKKHHTARNRWIAPKHFPDPKVLNAYLHPVVDTSREQFSWGIPDLDGLVTFCHSHMGWTDDETKKVIDPIIRRMEDKSMRQTRIDSFMRYEDGIKFAKIQSKRLRSVLGLSPLESSHPQPWRRKTAGATAPESFEEHKEAGSDDSLDELDEDFSINPITVTQNINRNSATQEFEVPRSEWKTKATKDPAPKQPNGKRTMSLAALSSASASTTKIATGSTSNNMGKSSAIDDALAVSVTKRRTLTTNLPKTSPPAYQKRSAAILEEENSLNSKPEGENQSKSGTTYEVINPSMI